MNEIILDSEKCYEVSKSECFYGVGGYLEEVIFGWYLNDEIENKW